jgi:hypothetical protein
MRLTIRCNVAPQMRDVEDVEKEKYELRIYDKNVFDDDIDSTEALKKAVVPGF